MPEPDQARDRFAVQRPLQRLPHFHLSKGGLEQLIRNMSGKNSPSGLALTSHAGAQLVGAMQRHLLDPVELAGLQAGQAHGIVGDGAEDHLVEIRLIGLEVLVPALQLDEVVLDPLHELEGTGADREPVWDRSPRCPWLTTSTIAPNASSKPPQLGCVLMRTV